MRPVIILIVLIAVGAVSMGLMYIFPKDGVNIAGVHLKFKTWDSLWDTTSTITIEDVGNYLAALDSAASDTTAIDSLNVKRIQEITSIQFKNEDSSPLFAFFEALHEARDKGENIHILHYGDSQIESDRMTSMLRERWQADFGGSGPGLICPVPITASAAITQRQSGNWKRYTAYGFDDGKAAHNKYGVLASFGRFTPQHTDGSFSALDSTSAWLEFSPSGMSSSTCRVYNEATMYFGHHKAGVRIDVIANDSVISSEVFEANPGIIKKTWRLGGTPKKLRFEFYGADSPDVQAVLLQSSGGVHVDNIALRGSNGNIFKRIDGSELGQQMRDLNVKFVIMQFGGNSIPYITGEKSARDYAQYFQAQIQYMKALNPNASFLIIGPSDMSTSVDGVYQTWPHLEDVVIAMKEAAFAENCGFWDMYSVMGGKNSMVSWVKNSPPFAGPDYTHFTPSGARKMADLLYKSIQREYEAWQKALP
jgi:lysophospholipase L1-like esterase